MTSRSRFPDTERSADAAGEASDVMKTPAYGRRRSPALKSGPAIGSYRSCTNNTPARQQASLMIVNALTSSIEKVENTGMTTDEFKSSFRTARSGDPESRS